MATAQKRPARNKLYKMSLYLSRFNAWLGSYLKAAGTNTHTLSGTWLIRGERKFLTSSKQTVPVYGIQ